MAAVSQMKRTKSQSSQWSSVFPNDQMSEQQSALFVKKLLAIAISSITYLRAIFPEHAFGDRYLEDLNLKILRDESACPGACQVIKWVKGCFDAMDKKYLKALIIGIYVDPDKIDTLIESYTFKFTYTREETGITILRNEEKVLEVSEHATKKATITLLRTILVLTQSLKSLPDNVLMTMKLYYYDEVTPSDYEPPGFKSASSDAFNYDLDTINIKVGNVNTPFHSVKVRVRTEKSQFDSPGGGGPEVEIGDSAATASEGWESGVKPPERTTRLINRHGLDQSSEEHMMVDQGCKSRSGSMQPSPSSDSGPQGPQAAGWKLLPKDSPASQQQEAWSDCETPSESQSPTQPDTAGSTLADSIQASPIVNGNDDGETVLCPCGCNEDDGLMISCEVCNQWQHAICFAITQEKDAPEKHICSSCADDRVPGRVGTDPSLSGVSGVELQAVCLWRRALMAATELPRVLAPGFARRLGVEVTVAQGLINRLEREGFLQASKKGKRHGKVVNKEKLEQGLQAYLLRFKPNVNGKKTEEEKKRHDEVDKLAIRTAQLTVSSKAYPPIEREKGLLPIITEEMVGTSPSSAVTTRSGKRKRIVSLIDQDEEFEVSSRQDPAVMQQCVKGRAKIPRKSSVVARPIVV